jgi:hypothetical protein
MDWELILFIAGVGAVFLAIIGADAVYQGIRRELLRSRYPYLESFIRAHAKAIGVELENERLVETARQGIWRVMRERRYRL